MHNSRNAVSLAAVWSGHRRLVSVLVLMVLATHLTLVAGVGPAAAADRVLTDGESFPNGFTVPAGETWEFNPSADTHVTVSGNVIVNGTLRMRPSSGSVEHFLQFTGINESGFVGGGSTPLASDVGLWVTGAGKLDISGTAKTSWSYDWASGWSSSDDIVAAPVNKGDYTTFTQVDGAGAVPAANSLGYEPELLNLTRNVRIEGTASGKTHIFIKSTSPQTIKYATIRYVAPWFQDVGDDGGHVTGRYGLHFHHNDGGSRGSIVEGVVIRDADNHAFVPHASHGITFTDTIAYNVTSEAYWWDESTVDACGEDDGCNTTDDLIYDSIVAAKVTPNPAREHSAAAIQLGAGDNMTIVNSVVVGMGDSGQNVSAYHWPSKDRGVWTFVSNVAHNNASHGIFVWQNTQGMDEGGNHVIDGFTAYHHASAAIDHGAYTNSYVYKNLTLLENDIDVIHSHALGKAAADGSTDTQKWSAVTTGGDTLHVFPHILDGNEVEFSFCDFGQVVFDEGSNAAGGRYSFVECGLTMADFDRSNIHPDTVIRVQDGNTAYQFVGTGAQTAIPVFESNPTPPPPPSIPPLGAAFYDIVGSIFEEDIEWLKDAGITLGCNPPDNTLFCPDDNVTRGQMAAFLNRALALPASAADPFIDDNNSIFEADIAALAAAEITLGCNPPDNNKYCPGNFVTRGQMAAFLVRALGLPPGPEKFVDDNGSIFEADIEALAAAGITLGCNPPANDMFCPNNFVTRAQMAAFLHRAEGWL